MKIKVIEKAVALIDKIEAAQLELEKASGYGILEISVATFYLKQISPAGRVLILANIINELKLTIETIKAELEAL